MVVGRRVSWGSPLQHLCLLHYNDTIVDNDNDDINSMGRCVIILLCGDINIVNTVEKSAAEKKVLITEFIIGA